MEINKANTETQTPAPTPFRTETPEQIRKLTRLTYTLIAIIVFILTSTSILIITNQGKKQSQLTQNPSSDTNNTEPTLAENQNHEWKTYTNLQYGFQFQFPPEFSNIPKDEVSPAFLSVCNENNIICISYLKNPYPESGFEAAGLSIQVIPNIANELECATYSPDPQNPQKLDSTKLINGVKFYYNNLNSAATGHQNQSVIYRAHHNNTCFEIDQSISTNSCEENSPESCPNKFTIENKNQIISSLNQTVLTFKFSGNQGSITKQPSSRERDGCIISGCSSEICSDKVKFSTCELKPGAECYKTTICERQGTGVCEWTQTEELTNCLSNTQ